MNQRSHRLSVISILTLCALVLLLILGVIVNAVHVRSSAQDLINSAKGIRSAGDADREIAAWRNRSDRRFFDEPALPAGDHSYNVKVENDLLNRLRIVPPTVVSMVVTMHNGELQSVILVMSTGREPSTTSGIWIQEWFGSGTMNDVRVNDKSRPSKATVDLPSAAPAAQREKAFALNTKCFVQPGGCRSAEDILPTVWQLRSAIQGPGP